MRLEVQKQQRALAVRAELNPIGRDHRVMCGEPFSPCFRFVPGVPDSLGIQRKDASDAKPVGRLAIHNP